MEQKNTPTYTYAELMEQAQALMRQAEKVRLTERKAAIEQIKAIMEDVGLTFEDLSSRKLGGSRGSTASTGSKVAPKYRNPVTGETWTGRGTWPKWVGAHVESGGDLESLLIEKPAQQTAGRKKRAPL